jgi:hypothetical protein
MSMKTSLSLLFLLAAVVGCKSSGASSSSAADFPCTCGKPEAAFEACVHPACAKGQSNPDNPDCACGKMTIGGQP